MTALFDSLAVVSKACCPYREARSMGHSRKAVEPVGSGHRPAFLAALCRGGMCLVTRLLLPHPCYWVCVLAGDSGSAQW